MASTIGTRRYKAQQRTGVRDWIRDYWFLIGAATIFLLPGLYALAAREWSTEQGAAGPIVLISGIWLLLRELRHQERPHRASNHLGTIWVFALLSLLACYLLGIMVGMGWLAWLAMYLTLIAVLGSYIGVHGLSRLWFPLTYLLFLVPPPYTLIAAITQPRKLWLSVTSVNLLSTFGYDVANNGTSLYIDQYELNIADACAGMNSLLSLLAIGLFYIYVLYRANWRYAAVLVVCILPLAMIANLVRIILILLTAHYINAETALGPLHDAAGLVMFSVALGCLIGVDVLLTPFRTWLAGSLRTHPSA